MSDNASGQWTCHICGTQFNKGTEHKCGAGIRIPHGEPIILARVFPCADECKKLREQVGQLQLGNAMSLQKIGELKDDYDALEQERDRLDKMLDDALGLLANHDQHRNSGWVADYEKLHQAYLSALGGEGGKP